MKKLITLSILLTISLTFYGQSLGYQDLSLLFSQNNNNGTARFTAMSGAFGALGGDVSAINVNPAGLGIFSNSTFSATFNSRNSDQNVNYFGTNTATQNQFFNLSNAGAVLVFDSAYSSDWKKFAIGFNYRLTKDFTDNFMARGNSGVATFRDFPLDDNNPILDYSLADEQIFSSNYNGEITEFNLGFSSVYQNKLYLGMALNFYNLDFSQQSLLTEFNSDNVGNTLDANLYQENLTTGTGFSANAGFIYKAHANFRFGLSYQTPTWFTEILQSTNIVENEGYFGDVQINVSNSSDVYSNTARNFFPSQELLYRLKTPSKLTASAAFIFGKSGLLSIDYMFNNYKNLELSNGAFNQENQFFQNQLKNTQAFNIGGEWRLKKFSLRGGYQFEQTPNITNALDAQSVLNYSDTRGYSLGAGYNFGNFKIDLSYRDNNRTSKYNFYQSYNVNPSNFQVDNREVAISFTLNL